MNEYEYITLILIPSTSVLLVAIVAWTGYQQHNLAKAKFKLDMFEKRFAVYKGVQIFLTIILKEGKLNLFKEDDEHSITPFFEFRRKTQDSTFLFGKEIHQYIDGIDKKSLELSSVASMIKPLPGGQERSELCRKQTLLLRELIGELPKLKEVFAPYLRFDKWK